MARRKKMGAMSTGMTIALVGGGVVLLYLVMNKSSTPVTSTTLVPSNQLATAQANLAAAQANAAASTTNTEINDASSTVSSIFSSIFS
jgi:predicted metalloprotease